MELEMKQGYKQTEVGLIPEDWSLFSFDNIFSFYSTSNYSKAEMSDDNEVGCIHYGLIHSIPNSQYNLENGIKYYVSKEQAKYEFVRDGDVIMVDASEDLEGLNKSVEIKGVGDNKFISGLHTYLLRDKKSLLADNFRGLVLNSKIVKNQMLQLAVGMKVFGVSKSQIVNVKIPLPPTLAEQKAIATALSDVDELISSLYVLIAKKKAIKQGAMQQLLTPPNKSGKRLDGFDGEWVERNLGEFVSFQVGFPFASQYFNEDNKGLRLVKNRDLKTDNRLIFYSGHYLEEYIVKNGDILIGMDGDFLPCLWSKGKALLNQRVGRLIKKRPISLMFLFYYLKKYLTEIENRTSATTVKHLSHSDVENMKLALPEVKEQKAIAQILSDMDEELEELTTKKEKYEHIKQGMMQELLTGKTRLV